MKPDCKNQVTLTNVFGVIEGWYGDILGLPSQENTKNEHHTFEEIDDKSPDCIMMWRAECHQSGG